MLAKGGFDRSTLHSNVVEYLRDRIISGDLRAGEPVPERQLSSDLNISRTPLREALKVLEVEGMIKILPYRGAIVADISSEEADEIMAVLSALEQFAAIPACQKMTDETCAEFVATHQRMVGFYEAHDRSSYSKENVNFHESIVVCSENATALKTYRTLNYQVLRLRYASNLRREDWTRSVTEHEAMIAAIGARDGQTLANLLSKHYPIK